MGPEVGPAFQRRSRGPPPVPSWRPVGGNCVQRPGNAGLRAAIRTARTLRARRDPSHARAPGAQMIRMASGSSLGSPTTVSGTIPLIVSVRLANGDPNFED
eukprot:gene25174-biopygen13503